MRRLNRITAGFFAGAVLGGVLTGCADWFQSKIPMDTETEPGSLSDFFTKEQKITSLATPNQIFVTRNVYPGKINVTWTAVEGATSYHIQRAVITPNADGTYKEPETNKEFEDLDWQTLNKSFYQSVYTDTILSNPGASNKEYPYHYYYRVMAQNIKSGLESDFTNPYEIWPETATEEAYETFNAERQGLGTLFACPTALEATKGKSTDTITLNWQGCEGASYYDIYRDTREDFTSAALLDSVYGTQTEYSINIMTTDQGKDFYFKVRARNVQDNASASTAVAMGYALQAGAPATPSNVLVVDGLGTSKDSISVSWEAIESTTIARITYSVYRTSSVDSVYTLCKKDIPAETNSFTDAGLSTGIYYYYYVQAVSYTIKDGTETGETLKSAFSESGAAAAKPAVGFLLSPPESLEALDADTADKIRLIWTPAIGSAISTDVSEKLEDSAFTYNIYKSAAQEGPFELLMQSVAGTAYEGGYLSQDVEKSNFYKISTLNAQGTESVYSITAAPVPEAPQSVTASKTANLAAQYASQADWEASCNGNEVYPVYITWKAPSSEPKPEGYNIYRSTKPDSAFRKLNDAHSRIVWQRIDALLSDLDPKAI